MRDGRDWTWGCVLSSLNLQGHPGGETGGKSTIPGGMCAPLHSTTYHQCVIISSLLLLRLTSANRRWDTAVLVRLLLPILASLRGAPPSFPRCDSEAGRLGQQEHMKRAKGPEEGQGTTAWPGNVGQLPVSTGEPTSFCRGRVLLHATMSTGHVSLATPPRAHPPPPPAVASGGQPANHGRESRRRFSLGVSKLHCDAGRLRLSRRRPTSPSMPCMSFAASLLPGRAARGSPPILSAVGGELARERGKGRQ